MTILEVACDFRYEAGFSIRVGFTATELVTGLVGPSGMGKTTILNLIAGLFKPTSGAIQLSNQVLFDSKKGINVTPDQRSIGYVFQDYQLFPHLSVEQNLRFGERRTRSKGVSFTKVTKVLRLHELLTRMPSSLSGGQKQRVALGRAILFSPNLLLLDEPLSSVDEEHRKELIGFLGEVIEEFSIPALVVSHDASFIDGMATSVVTIDEDWIL